MPSSLSYFLSQSLADISYFFYKDAVRAVKGNLSLAFPDYDERRLASMARETFRNYSKYLVDYARFTHLPRPEVIKKIVEFEGRETFEGVLRKNKGLILLTAHLGNWELGGIFFGSLGLKVNVVTLQDQNMEIDDFRTWYRENYNVRTVTIGNSPFSSVELLAAIGRGETVAMLIDRCDSRQDHLVVDFFGKPTCFPRGPLILARLTGAPLAVAFVVHSGGGYKGYFEEPITVGSDGDEKQALNQIVKLLEKYIISYPTQWYNFVPI